MIAIDVPKDNYAVFQTEKGKIPDIIFKAWQKIWHLTAKKELSRKRTFDFELYDKRAADPNSAQVDIFIAIP
jgi:predicted transcriptional regulator YdeE